MKINRLLSPALALKSSLKSASYLFVRKPKGNRDGEMERLGETEVVHRFVEAEGDSATVRWHLVEAGQGEPVVFLHGLPESWFQWHRQIDALARDYRVVAVDLKGYGQSDKSTGDYRQEGVGEQLLALLNKLGLDRFNLVSHDRGTAVADYMAANHPDRTLRYIRGQQHLYHFNPLLAPQERIFTHPIKRFVLSMPRSIVATAYSELCKYPVNRSDLVRTVREFSYPGIGQAVARYFNSSSFTKEWIERRTRLMEAWRFPVLVLQGYHDPNQPHEFYEGVEKYMPDARVEFIDAGHFFVLERPLETTQAIRSFLEKPLP